MCLTIPKQVISISKDKIVVKSCDKRQIVGSLIKIKKDDWVLTQNNVIISKITKNQAEEINNLLK